MKGNVNLLFLISILISLLLHALLFSASRHIWFSAGGSELFDQTEKLFNIQSVQHRLPKPTSRDLVDSYVRKIKFEDPAAQSKPLERMIKPFEKIEMPESTPVSKKEKSKIEEVDTAKDLKVREVREEIAIEKRIVDKDTLREMDLSQWIADAKKIAEEQIEVPEEFVEEMPGFTPGRVTGLAARTGVAAGTHELDAQPFERTAGYESIDEFLYVDLAVYREPGESEGYYQISIIPAGQAGLEVMPKEIIFLVDTSLSIRPERLKEFKQGIKYSLANLNPADTFNLFSFKEDISYFSKRAVQASPENIERALAFLDRIIASQRTDLYQAFLESIHYEASQFPSYLVLLSDGRPNTGITSPVQIISEITAVNAKKRSIFTFTGGPKVNRFLLDFVAYENRGWSEFSKEDKDISEKFSDFYDKIKNPILTDVRFQISQLDPDDIFPKHLPDIYRDTAFLIYGRFDREKQFSVRISGEVHGKKKEMIFTRDLSKASAGNEEIAQAWALNKIYYLTSELTMQGYKAEKVQEIRRLSKKYDIRTPYDLYF